MKDYYPIGSVVKIKDGKLPLMIIGQHLMDKDGNRHDYIGVPHPQGYVNNQMVFTFNYSDVSEVIFRGLNDDNVKKVQDLYEKFDNGKIDREVL